MSRALLAQALGDNPVPYRTVCPVCKGGDSTEQSLVFWTGNDGKVLATCHRNSCPIETVPVESAGDAPVKVRTFSDGPAMMALCNPVKTWLNDAYEYKFNHELIRDLIKQAVGTSGNSSVLVLPMYSRDRLTIEGFISKPVCPSPGQSKSYTTLIKDSTGMSWYFGSALADVYGRDVVIVVEDPLSAIALFQLGYHAVSLNGTHLNEKRIQELAGATRHLVLALDADATATAITYQRRYGSRFGTCRVLRLRKDIKDTPNKEARAIVSTFLGEN